MARTNQKKAQAKKAQAKRVRGEDGQGAARVAGEGPRAEEEATRAEDSEPQVDKDEADEPGDLYSVLGLKKDATELEIKKAYHRMALKLHPDKNPGDESAKEKFQTLQSVFSILGDPEKRRLYDETGSTDDWDVGKDNFDNLYQYYRTFFSKVTVEEIEKFEAEYRGSEEELKDLKGLYTRFSGDMHMLFQYMLCAEADVDSHRFKEALEEAIREGELKPSKKFERWAAKVARNPAPVNPLKLKKKSSKAEESGSDLSAIIRSRGAARQESLLDGLVAKYGGKTAKKRVAAGPEISEEEFAKIQERILKPKRGKR